MATPSDTAPASEPNEVGTGLPEDPNPFLTATTTPVPATIPTNRIELQAAPITPLVDHSATPDATATNGEAAPTNTTQVATLANNAPATAPANNAPVAAPVNDTPVATPQGVTEHQPPLVIPIEQLVQEDTEPAPVPNTQNLGIDADALLATVDLIDEAENEVPAVEADEPHAELASLNLMPPPKGGYPKPQHGQLMSIVRNMEPVQRRDWLTQIGYYLFLQIYGTNTLNDETPQLVAKLKTALSDFVGLIDAQIATPNPPLDPHSYRPRTFLLRNLPQSIYQKLLDRGVWCNDDIAIFVHPPVFTIPRHIGSFKGFTTGEIDVIKQVFVTHLRSTRVQAVVDQLRISHPTLNDVSLEEAMDIIINSIDVKVMFLQTEPYSKAEVPIANLYVDSPTSNPKKWESWQRFLRNICFTTTLHGAGTVMDLWRCGKCSADDHPSGVCPFPRLPGWRYFPNQQNNQNNTANQNTRGGF